jgi:transposase
MERHGIDDAAWDRIKGYFPDEKPDKPGRPWKSHRVVLSAILWILVTGAAWRDLPTSFGPWSSIYNRFRRWTRDGFWQSIWDKLLDELELEGKIDNDLWSVDGSNVRAHRCAAGSTNTDPDEPADHGLGRSRGGYGTKFHVVVSGNGIPLAITITAGQSHESTQFEEVICAVPIGALDQGVEPIIVSAASSSNAEKPEETSIDMTETASPALEAEPTETSQETTEKAPKSAKVKPKAIGGDKAYSANPIREYLKKTGSRQ